MSLPFVIVTAWEAPGATVGGDSSVVLLVPVAGCVYGQAWG